MLVIAKVKIIETLLHKKNPLKQNNPLKINSCSKYWKTPAQSNKLAPHIVKIIKKYLGWDFGDKYLE